MRTGAGGCSTECCQAGWRSGADSDEESRDELAAMVFASLFSGQITPPPTVVQAPTSAVAESWRKTDRDMTLASGQTTVSAGRSGEGPSRMVTHVSTEELGKMCLVVDRSQGGVSVTLRVENQDAANVVMANQAALIARLQAVGVQVSSVRVATMTGGTGLAQAHDVAASSGEGTASEARGRESDLRKRGRRMDWLG